MWGAARGFVISWGAEISHRIAAFPCAVEEIWMAHPHIV